MTPFVLHVEIPVRQDEGGSLRVGNTKVLLDLIVYAYWRGETPEQMVDSYSSLALEDVYLALGYYLHHREEIDGYLREQEAEIAIARETDRANYPNRLTREMLLARLEARRTQSEQ